MHHAITQCQTVQTILFSKPAIINHPKLSRNGGAVRSKLNPDYLDTPEVSEHWLESLPKPFFTQWWEQKKMITVYENNKCKVNLMLFHIQSIFYLHTVCTHTL